MPPTQPGRTVFFDERMRLPRSADIGLSLFLAGCMVSVPFLWPYAEEWAPRVVLIGCMGVIPALLLSMHSRVTVDSQWVRLALVPVWRKAICRADIIEARPRRILAREMGGWGLRRTLDGAVGLVMRGPEAVEIKLAGGRRYVLGTTDPEALRRALAPLPRR